MTMVFRIFAKSFLLRLGFTTAVAGFSLIWTTQVLAIMLFFMNSSEHSKIPEVLNFVQLITLVYRVRLTTQ